MAASCISVTAASPQNSPANSTKGRFRRLRARTQAANSIAVKGDESFEVESSVTVHTGTHRGTQGEPGTQERGDEELL